MENPEQKKESKRTKPGKVVDGIVNWVCDHGKTILIIAGGILAGGAAIGTGVMIAEAKKNDAQLDAMEQLPAAEVPELEPVAEDIPVEDPVE